MSVFLVPPPITTSLVNDAGKISLDWLNWFQQIAQLSFPVSSYYVTANAATNPGTMLGFGQWTGVGYFNANATPVYVWTRTK